MKLNVIQLGLAFAVICAASALLVGLINLFCPSYGVAFLKLLDSLYPGYHFGKWGFGGVVVATLYAALDGFVCGVELPGFIIYLANVLKKKRSKSLLSGLLVY